RDGPRDDSSAVLRAAEGVRSENRVRRHREHLVQRPGRADRVLPGRRLSLLHADRAGPAGARELRAGEDPAETARGRRRLAKRIRAGLRRGNSMKHQDDKKQLRHFGLFVGGIFAVIGLWPMVFRAEAPRLWSLALAVALIVPALVLPRSLTYVHRVWMAAGEAMGWINTRIILSVIFYGIVTPMGIVMRRFGRDPMQRRF